MAGASPEEIILLQTFLIFSVARLLPGEMQYTCNASVMETLQSGEDGSLGRLEPGGQAGSCTPREEVRSTRCRPPVRTK